MLITKEQISEIGHQIQPNQQHMDEYQRSMFDKMVGDLSQKNLLLELEKKDRDVLDALVRLYISNTLNATQQKEIYQKILDLT